MCPGLHSLCIGRLPHPHTSKERLAYRYNGVEAFHEAEWTCMFPYFQPWFMCWGDLNFHTHNYVQHTEPLSFYTWLIKHFVDLQCICPYSFCGCMVNRISTHSMANSIHTYTATQSCVCTGHWRSCDKQAWMWIFTALDSSVCEHTLAWLHSTLWGPICVKTHIWSNNIP